MDFTPWLGICISNKTHSPQCPFGNNNITLIANLSGIEIDSVWFSYYVNGTNYNKTATASEGNSYKIIIPPSELIGGTNVTWNVYANDSIAVYNNSWKTFYVYGKTILSINPIFPDGLSGWYISEPIFTLTNPDAVNIFYQWDLSEIRNYSAQFGLENIPNLPKESAGILDLNYWSNAICGNESNQGETFKVDLTSPSIIDLNPMGIIYNNLKPEISAYLEEIYGSNSGINKGSVIMKVDGVYVNASVESADSLDAIVSYIPLNNLSPGTHNIIVNITDKAGRNNETSWEFYINISAVFNLQIYSPLEKIYGEKRINFNMSSDEELKKISYINWNEIKPRWKILCKDCLEYGNKKIKTKSFSDGNHNITIKAEDYSNQISEENILFSVDSTLPKILKTEPQRNQVTNGSNFYLEYTEDNLKEISLNWNPTQKLNCNESGKNKECKFDVNLTAYDGEYINFYFNVSDYIRSVLSRETRVFVDTTSPKLNISFPENASYGRKVPFNISVSEDVLLEYYDNSVQNPRWKRLCSNCEEYGNSKIRILSFSRGNHDLIIRAVDEAGNSDVEKIKFSVSY